jgi:hypothetical protein
MGWARHTVMRHRVLPRCGTEPAALASVRVMAGYRTTLPIAATAEAVWAILIDFDRGMSGIRRSPRSKVIPSLAAPSS